LHSIPSFDRPLSLSTQAYWLCIFNNFCQYIFLIFIVNSCNVFCKILFSSKLDFKVTCSIMLEMIYWVTIFQFFGGPIVMFVFFTTYKDIVAVWVEVTTMIAGSTMWLLTNGSSLQLQLMITHKVQASFGANLTKFVWADF